MVADTGGNNGDGGRRGIDEPPPEEENNEEDSVDETETQKFMYRMKRRSDELTGRKNKF